MSTIDVGANIPSWATRSWLYVGADDSAAVERALASEADAVILDLEDLVLPSRKSFARALVADVVTSFVKRPIPRLFVRINHPSTAPWREDLGAAVRPGLAGIRVPKVEAREEVEVVARYIAEREQLTGLAAGSVSIVGNIESAAGVLRLSEIVGASRLERLGFGEADFSRDVNATVGPDETETFVARSLMVLSSRASGLEPPCAGVYLNVNDDVGLVRTTERARGLGFFGRTAVAVGQIDAINVAFTPTADDVARCRDLVARMNDAAARGSGNFVLDTGRFVDIAVVRAAERTLALAAVFADRASRLE